MSELKYISARVKVEFETSTHLGAGHGNVGVNRIIKRTADRRPYVPASAIKGALRMAAERLMQLVVDEDAEVHLQRKGGAVARPHQVCRGPKPEGMCQSKSPCLVCHVFGNGWTGLRLLVDDGKSFEDDLMRLKKLAFKHSQAAYKKALEKGIYSEKDKEEDVFLKPDFKLDHFAGTDRETLTRAQIDRKRRGAAKGALFTSEYALAEQTFMTRLSGWLPLTVIDEAVPPLELVLLAASVGFVDQIGGEASTGHGLCKLSIVDAKGADGTIDVEGAKPYAREELIEALDYLPFFS